MLWRFVAICDGEVHPLARSSPLVLGWGCADCSGWTGWVMSFMIFMIVFSVLAEGKLEHRSVTRSMLAVVHMSVNHLGSIVCRVPLGTQRFGLGVAD